MRFREFLPGARPPYSHVPSRGERKENRKKLWLARVRPCPRTGRAEEGHGQREEGPLDLELRGPRWGGASGFLLRSPAQSGHALGRDGRNRDPRQELGRAGATSGGPGRIRRAHPALHGTCRGPQGAAGHCLGGPPGIMCPETSEEEAELSCSPAPAPRPGSGVLEFLGRRTLLHALDLGLEVGDHPLGGASAEVPRAEPWRSNL